jgi:hypothetical protein
MSSYAQYCQDQATACARRGGLARSPEIVTYCRKLELRWLKLAQQAHETGGALGRECKTSRGIDCRECPIIAPVRQMNPPGQRGARPKPNSLRSKRLR